MKRCFVIILLILTSIGCENVQRRNLDEYYTPSGTARFILPEISKWYNFSEHGQCFREKSAKYLDFSELKKSFGLSYAKSLQLQIGLNEESEKLLASTTLHVLPVKQQESIFFSVSDKIQSNVKYFSPPRFNRTHLIWLDPALKSPKVMKRLKVFFKSPAMDLGYPVFISLCMNSLELKKFVSKNLKLTSYKYLGHEALSQFDKEANRIPQFQLDLKSFFGSKMKLIFYTPTNIIPSEFVGIKNTKKY